MAETHKRISPGRLEILMGKTGGAPPEGEAYEGGGEKEGMVEDMVTKLRDEVLPITPDDKKPHIEKAIAELEACLEPEGTEEIAETPEAPMGETPPMVS